MRLSSQHGYFQKSSYSDLRTNKTMMRDVYLNDPQESDRKATTCILEFAEESKLTRRKWGRPHLIRNPIVHLLCLVLDVQRRSALALFISDCNMFLFSLHRDRQTNQIRANTTSFPSMPSCFSSFILPAFVCFCPLCCEVVCDSFLCVNHQFSHSSCTPNSISPKFVSFFKSAGSAFRSVRNKWKRSENWFATWQFYNDHVDYSLCLIEMHLSITGLYI